MEAAGKAEIEFPKMEHVNGFVPMIRRLREENECLREELRMERWAGKVGWCVAVVVSVGFALVTL